MNHHPDESVTSGQRSEDNQEQLPSVWAAVGLPRACAPDAAAPPVDREALARLARGELGPDEADDVAGNIVLFRPWRRAYAEILGSLPRN